MADSHATMSMMLRFDGQYDRAIKALETASRLHPRHPSWYFLVQGHNLTFAGRYADVIEFWSKHRAKISSTLAAPEMNLAIAHAGLGHVEASKEYAAKIQKISPESSIVGWRQLFPIKDKAVLEDRLALLHQAGVPKRPPLPLPDKPSIAVLPFKNLSGDPEQDYFSDAIGEDIRMTLSRVPDLFVSAENAATAFKGPDVTVRKAAQELGVRYILQGSVQRDGDNVRINARLIDATEGRQIWGERYQRQMSGLFALQDEISLKIADALHTKLASVLGTAARVRDRTTHNLEAWDLYVRGIAVWKKFTHENLLRARHLWERAVEIEPDYAEAWAHLGQSYLSEMRTGWAKEPKHAYETAKELAEKVLAIDPNNPRSLTLLAWLNLYARKHDQAINYAKQALVTDPNDGTALYALADIMRYSGNFDEAIHHIRQLMRLNPNYPEWCLQSIGMSFFHSGQHEKSIETFDELIRRNPSYSWAHAGLAMNYAALNRLDEARDEAEAEMRVNPKISLSWLRKVVPYKEKQHLDEIVEALAKAGVPE